MCWSSFVWFTFAKKGQTKITEQFWNNGEDEEYVNIKTDQKIPDSTIDHLCDYSVVKK